jgi:hypothetical protein
VTTTKTPIDAKPRCATSGCERAPRKRGRTCGRCATRAWRERHRKTIAARERTRTFTPEQAALRRASAIFFTDLRRRDRKREPCEECGRGDVVPHWPDVTRPLKVVWFCRVHRANERDRLAEEAAATKKVVAWKTLGERFEAEWPQLAPAIQARLRTEAERSSVFAIVRANPQSPLYRQQLVAAFGRYCASLEPASSG